MSDETNDLFVDGDAADAVVLDGAWTNTGQTTVDLVTYDQYDISGTDALANIDTDIAVTVM